MSSSECIGRRGVVGGARDAAEPPRLGDASRPLDPAAITSMATKEKYIHMMQSMQRLGVKDKRHLHNLLKKASKGELPQSSQRGTRKRKSSSSRSSQGQVPSPSHSSNSDAFQLTPSTFFPSYGFTSGEYAIFQVILANGNRKKPKPKTKRND